MKQTANKQNHSNGLGIQKGLVSNTKKELIHLGFLGLGLKSKDQAQKQPNRVFSSCSLNPGDEKEKQSEKEPETHKLNHPTRLRPQMPKRRLPSRINSTAALFKSSLEYSSEDPTRLHNNGLSKALKQAIGEAEKKYRSHYQYGNHPRHEKGWLSWLRHGYEGQERAEKFQMDLQNATSAEILERLDEFFQNSETKYNHHSFSSYLMDELNLLLNTRDGTEVKINNSHYTVNSWEAIRNKLNALNKEEFEYQQSGNIQDSEIKLS